MPDSPIADRLTAWQAAGVIDADTTARIEAFEAARPPAERSSSRITVSEVIAYIGTVVLLVGVAFLYGTEYKNLGIGGRLVLIAVVVAAGLAAGELVQRVGSTAASRRARAAGWSVAAVGVATWFAQAFADFNILTQRPQYDYVGASPDTSGSVMLACIIGAAFAAVLLWRSGAGILAFVTAALAYTVAAALDGYGHQAYLGWGGEVTWLVPAVILAALAETITHGPDRRSAREILRFLAIVPPVITALGFSFSPEDTSLELFGGFLALGAFGLALLRGSAGYAIAGGVALFIVINV